MVEHIVLFKFKEGTLEEKIELMTEGLRGLQEKIPGIVDLSVGRNFTDRGKGFELGLVVRMENKKNLEAYHPHPAHQEVVETLIRPILEDIVAVDYEF